MSWKTKDRRIHSALAVEWDAENLIWLIKDGTGGVLLATEILSFAAPLPAGIAVLLNKPSAHGPDEPE